MADESCVYSGLYTHRDMVYDLSWTGRAIATQQRWCRSIGASYVLLRDMDKWARFYPHPEAWSFGTLIKFRALEHFVQSHHKAFVWVDLDVYPAEAAYGVPLPSHNLFYAPRITIEWAREHNAWHMNNKLAWWNPPGPEYLAWSTGMFVMDRETAFRFWDWLNRDVSINHPAWWQAYYQRQCALSADRPYDFGSEEAIKEEWLNTNQVDFELMSDTFHSVHPSYCPHFLHFFGQNKKNYPYDAVGV